MIRIVFILILCVIFVSCKNESDKKIDLTLIHAWGSTEPDHIVMREIYNDFKKENQDINLHLISMPTREKMLDKLEDMIMVGDIPDVINFGGIGKNRTYDFIVENDMALDIMPYLEQDAEFSSNISRANINYWTNSKNQIYNITDVLSLSGGYWYNEDIFDYVGIKEIPKTWEEFISMCESLRKYSEVEGEDFKPLQVSFDGYMYFADHILADDRGDISEDALISKILSKDRKNELEIRILGEIYNFSKSNEEEYSYRDETELFNEGKLAIYLNGVWGAQMINDDINVKYALIPTISGESISCESACMGYVIGNTENDEKKNAAIRFIKYMLSEEVQRKILEETEQIPANAKIDLSKYKNDKKRLYQAIDTVNSASIKIDIPDNIWTSEQKEKFINDILGVLSEK